jgi:hypothetical protein
MQDQVTFLGWLKGRWQLGAGLFGAALILCITTAIVLSGPGDVTWQTQAAWPQSAGVATSGLLPVSVYRHDEQQSAQLPLPGVKVTLYQYAGGEEIWSEGILVALEARDQRVTELWSGVTDELGSAIATLPAQEELLARERAFQGKDANPTQTKLALVYERNGERRVEIATLSFMQGEQLELMMDRPLYQPGEVIKLRALLVDADTGAPRTTELRWRARDPRGNLVMDEVSKTSGAGVGVIELALAPQAIQGEYTIEVSGGGASVSRLVPVQPFRLPAFTVTVVPGAAEIEPVGSATGVIRATYTSGEPVRGADAEVIIRGQTQAMGFGVEKIAGKTNDKGELAWSWAPVGGFVQGGALEVSARVVTEAGRAESGGGQVLVRGGQPAIELIPAERGFFAAGLSNRGWLIVRDAAGRPVGDAPVTVYVPLDTGERKLELKTDAAGRAELVWSGARVDMPLSVAVTVPGEAEPLRVNLDVPYRSGGGVFVSGVVEARAGEPLEVPVAASPQARHVIAAWQGRVVAHAKVGAGEQTAKLALPRWASGLIVLVAMDHTLSQLDTLPMWVVQPGGDVVRITPDRADGVYAPGEQAAVGLSFAPAGAAQGVGTTFALVGVDEALYALRERDDVAGYVERLRRMPGGLASLMARGVGTGAGDELDQKIARARFERAVVDSAASFSPGSGADRSQDLRHLERDPARRGWGMVLVLLTLAFAGVGGWSVVRSMSRPALTLKRVAALVGLGLAVIPAIVVLWSLDGRGAGLMGGGLVWAGVVLCWAAGAGWALREELRLGQWIVALLCAAGLMLLVVIVRDALYVAAWFDDMLMVVRVGLGIAFVLGVLLWPLMLMHRGRWHAGLGIGTFAGMLLCAPLVLTFTMGRSADFAPASVKVAMREMAEIEGEYVEVGVGAPLSEIGLADSELEPEPAEASPRVRAYFPETMVWAPEVTANAQGEAEVKFEVPDSITTWRLNAWASTSDGRFGTGQAQIKALQSFFVDVDQPTQLTSGDVAELPVTLVNNQDQPLTARLSAEVVRGGLEIVAAPPAQVTVPARSRVLRKMRVRAGGVGGAALRLVARVGDDPKAGDAIERPLQIVPDGRVLASSRSGLVQGGWEASASLPADTIAGTGRADVRVFPGVEAAAMEGLDAMLRQPTGCFEQSSSATYPNVLILQTLRQIPADKWPDGPEKWAEAHTKALRLARLGYQRMLTFQHPDGGFALYPDSGEASLMLTAYALMQLDELGRVIAVDPEVSRRAGQWIVNQMDGEGRWPTWANGISGSMATSRDVGQVRATAWIAGALAASQHRDQFMPSLGRALDYIVERHTSVEDAQAMALGVWALTMAGRKDDARKLAARLASAAKRDGDQAWWGVEVGTWMGGWGRWADLETTAMVAWALLMLEDQAELISPAFTYLARQRSPWGGWGSTQSTVWSLRAMAALRARGAAQDADLSVTLGGAALAQASGRGEPGKIAVRGGQPVVHHLSTGDGLGGGEHRVSITTTARTTAIAQLTSTWAVPWSSPSARVEGERLEIRIVSMPRKVRFAQDVAAQVVVRNTAALELGALIIELPLAPGAYAPREGLDAMVQAGEVDHYEVLPTHVRLYVRGMAGDSQRTFTWRYTPLVRGTFSMPPLRAYVFYAPEPVTERDGGELVVE